MAIIPVSSLGALGVVSDRADSELPPEAWTNARNMRFRDDKVVKFKGQSTVFGQALHPPYHLLPMQTESDSLWLYAGPSKIYATDGSTHADVTRTSGDYTAGHSSWTACNLNGIAVFNNGTDPPQSWGTPLLTTKFQNLPNWPANTLCKCMRSFKNFLVALAVTESGNYYPHMIRISAPAAPGSVPSTWVPGPTSTAYRAEFASRGAMLDAAPLGQNVLMVYKEDMCIAVRLDAPPRYWRMDPVFQQEGIGLLARNCVAEVLGRHLIVSQGDWLLHDGQTYESIIDGRRRRAIFTNIDDTHYRQSFLLHNISESEVWFCYPESGQSLCTMAEVWNYKNNTLTRRELPGVAHAGRGVLSGGGGGFIDSYGMNIDDADFLIDEQRYNPTQERVILARPSPASLLQIDVLDTFDGQTFLAYVERTGLGLAGRARDGSPIVDFERMKFVRRLWPRIRSNAPVTFYVGRQDTVNGPVEWGPPITFDPATQQYIDPYVTTRALCYRIEAFNNSFFELSRIDWEIELMGRF